jgi:uncharacterized phiE125 gp8 family phage protein
MLSLVTKATDMPVKLNEAKTHLRVLHDDDDVYIDGLIASATDFVENYLRGRVLAKKTYDYYVDAFPETIRLPKAPVQAISSIKYLDSNGDQQTLASSSYTSDLISQPARIIPAYGLSWPETRSIINSVVVRFDAGYASVADVPKNIVTAIKILVGEWYNNREVSITGTIISEVPVGLKRILDPEVLSFYA